MGSGIVMVVLLAGIVLIVWWSSANHRTKREKYFRDEAMPAELQSARLVISEERLFSDVPVPLSGRPDQVYLTTDGDLIPVDTKTRKKPRVYPKDRMQLSAYKVLLNHCDHPAARGVPVRNYGYIRFVVAGRVSYVRVGLASEAQVVSLYDRYLHVIRSEARPAGPVAGPRACVRCDYRDICPRQ